MQSWIVENCLKDRREELGVTQEHWECQAHCGFFRIHVDDTDFALSKKLFADDYQSPAWKENGHASLADFLEFGKRIGVAGSRCTKLPAPFLERQISVESLINRSFLDPGSKRAYLLDYNAKRNYLIA